MGSVHEISAPEPAASRSALVRAELEKILASQVFARADRISHFLRLIVENELRRESEPLKETLIGVQVYGRPAGYDPKAEPIVRTEARRLRHKLDEYYASSAADHRVIITVPTGGYSPHFEIRSEVPKVVALPAEQAPSMRRFVSGTEARWTLVGLMCLIGLAIGWKLLAPTHKPAVAVEVAVTRLPGFEFQPSLSPDGKLVAFVWNGTDQNYDIYVKRLADGRMRRLTRSASYDLFPSWSPDGRSIALLRLLQDGTKNVFIIPASGGEERLLCTTRSVQPTRVHDASVLSLSPGPAWSSDEKFIAVSDRSNREEPDSLYFVSVATGQKKRATTPEPHDVGDYYPAFSRDGRMLAFVRVGNQRRISEIYVQKPRRRGVETNHL
jgi:hypothetical protein